jgi:hypothetical protein
MKKLIILATLFFLMTGCGSTDESINFEVATADKTVRLTSQDDSPMCSVHLELSYATEANGEHKAEIINNIIEKRLLNMQDVPMQMAVDSFANMYTASYKYNLLHLYNQDLENKKKGEWYNYHYIVKTSTEQGYKGATVYHVYLDYYEGGAHGINQHLTINFEQLTGRQLTLADVFVPGYERQLSTILQKALCSYTGASNLKELKDQGYLYSMDMFPSENFVLCEETITFIYNPYEIAPYEKGSVELTLSYSDIDDILNKNL